MPQQQSQSLSRLRVRVFRARVIRLGSGCLRHISGNAFPREDFFYILSLSPVLEGGQFGDERPNYYVSTLRPSRSADGQEQIHVSAYRLADALEERSPPAGSRWHQALSDTVIYAVAIGSSRKGHRSEDARTVMSRVFTNRELVIRAMLLTPQRIPR